ncbi:MAG: pseudouridine synthase [bacterium]|nr:pseudouridine synthase [bacterium]
MRLNAYLARAGVASRRGADALIKAGRVTINGKRGELNSKIAESDQVKLDHKLVHSQQLRYILLYKPTGHITTLKDEEDRPKVIDLIKITERVVPVGRLDFNTTGVLLLTNDGELTHKLMHPSFEVDKVYEAEIRGVITPKMLDLLSNSIQLDDGPTAPAKVKKLADNKIQLTIHEGRNHQVKRMLEAVGAPVKKLHRIRYGSLTLEGLKFGAWRDLTEEEIGRLKAL